MEAQTVLEISLDLGSTDLSNDSRNKVHIVIMNEKVRKVSLQNDCRRERRMEVVGRADLWD
jgi:hypothetical protein